MADTPDVKEFGWTAIVITCTSGKVREALENECKRMSRGGLLPKHEFLLVVDDPGPKIEDDRVASSKRVTAGVGSGGATINALLIAIERLSAFHNHTTINNELVHNSRILVIHHGRTLVHSPGGSAFLRINAEHSAIPGHLRMLPPTLLQHAIWMATNIAAKCKRGVWITSLDAFLSNVSTLEPPSTEGLHGALVCTVSTHLEHAKNHGVVVSGTGNSINKMEYKLSLEQLSKLIHLMQ
ncbi:hypothetical protein SK128_013752 [Halocaridina rubra]|uniref:GDP-fucose pyrophosphorylase domain-containing protein n=1 Tax=Halocaridina rubra TaxID=373956 RepID=A0AAN8W9A8_HALRR